MCTGTWTNIVREAGGRERGGDTLPELKVTADRYGLTVRYAGASGDFNPIHIDEEFALLRRPARAGSCTACGRWRRSRAP